MPDNQLPPAEVSRRIVAGMGFVYDLFQEMNVLFRLLHQGLQEAEAGIHVHAGKGYQLRRGKAHITAADRYLRTDMGFLASIAPTAADTVDQEAVSVAEVADDAAEEDEEDEVDRATVAITSSTQFLGLRAVLYDRSVSAPLDFQPVIVAAVLDGFGRYKKAAPGTVESDFTVKRSYPKRLVKDLLPGIAKGEVLTTRIPGHYMRGRISAVHQAPLAAFTSEASVQEFIDRVAEMVERARG